MPTVRGSASTLQRTTTASAPSATATGASQPLRSARDTRDGELAHEHDGSPMPEPATISSLMGQTANRVDALDAGELGACASARREVGPRAEHERGEQCQPEQRATQRATRSQPPARLRSSGARNISTRMSRPCSTACASCKNTQRDERQRHHLRDARDRIVEHGARGDVGARSGTSARTPRRRRPRSARRRASRTASPRACSRSLHVASSVKARDPNRAAAGRRARGSAAMYARSTSPAGWPRRSVAWIQRPAMSGIASSHFCFSASGNSVTIAPSLFMRAMLAS